MNKFFEFFRTAPKVQSDKFRALVNKGYAADIRKAIENEKIEGVDDTVAVGSHRIRVVRIGEAPSGHGKK